MARAKENIFPQAKSFSFRTEKSRGVGSVRPGQEVAVGIGWDRAQVALNRFPCFD